MNKILSIAWTPTQFILILNIIRKVIMKKALFASLIAVAAAASFADSRIPEWNHANDSGPIPGLAKVEYHDAHDMRKDDDRVKFTAPATGVREITDIGYNDTYARSLQNGSNWLLIGWR